MSHDYFFRRKLVQSSMPKCSWVKHSLISSIFLIAVQSTAFAGTSISDQRLSNETQGKKQFSEETLDIIESEAAKPKEEQQKNSNHKSNRNNKIIQETQLEGSTMSDYLLQKKRAADQVGLIQSPEVAPINRIVLQERHENIRVTYPDGVVVEMKH
ncbi:hypothetical protein M5F00_12055 [Acinetobacter sp. ANC 4945]|uniref:Uncharacterized protein n=4 Tax=Acinetobacter TaxID=469 RepID=A0A1T1H5W1_9GAMM|nr:MULTISPECIES: hypothetical protein [Acinetobacter]MCL6248593.1 hypothetical protein [Acinetobacter amyesii]OOV85216.1 hypothetical protein B1202_00755 [Acinetobacter amyesii]